MPDTLEHIIKKYNIDTTQKSPFLIAAGRHRCLPRLFTELGFKTGAEIGVHRGQYSMDLLRKIPGLKLYGIDLWESYPGYKDFEKTTIAEAFIEAHEVTKAYDCTLIKDWSHEAVKQFEDGTLDFVYIDGNHAFEFVVQDIALWSKKVRSGGIVCGHDFDDYSNHRKLWNRMNVINAITGWCKSYRIHPWFVLNNNKNKTWMYVK